MASRQRRTSNSSSTKRHSTHVHDETEGLLSQTTHSPIPMSERSYAGSFRHRAYTSGSLSSSYKTPGRFYIPHAGSYSQEPLHYSSAGVREQTAELSSSLLNGVNPYRLSAEIHRASDTSPSRLSLNSVNDHLEARRESLKETNRPDIILERSEPASPDALTAHDIFITDASDKLKHNDVDEDVFEDTPLLHTSSANQATSKIRLLEDQSDDDVENQDYAQFMARGSNNHKHKTWRHSVENAKRTLFDAKTWSLENMTQTFVYRPASMLPAVFLGLLLNLLDALSYGIILFPLGEDIFSGMGPDGVSMFFVSCITSQLVISAGSIFRGGVGSEMIEVVPFFHKMCYMIMASMGTSNPAAVRATVIVSYAMSSILTGLVFFGLGIGRLGTLVSFFPHSILTGCIGGVGIFLFLTGVEVTARLDGNLDLNLPTLKTLIQAQSIMLWLPPLVLAISLLLIKRYYDRPWLVPTFYISITVIFYIITTAIPSITMESLRNHGWVFEAPASDAPFYHFYSYYQFKLVDWTAVWKTVPTQLALTFFGILHVPINLPNLALVVQEDNVGVDRELILHGISNTLSALMGSIQNYLCFVNSVLFIESGGDSRLAGFMLTLATIGLWMAGPAIIGYIPVMVVGTLIYMLGIDLTIEALVASYGRLKIMEYLTIVCIAFVMGVYDFVVGIGVGIGLACLVYVVQTSQKSAIRAEFTGQVAESTVRRPFRQRQYLHKVGPQIRVVKLGGYLFFGSIVKVEAKVRNVIDAEAFANDPIRFLVLDFSHVTGIDFSAAEAFNRMNRILHRRDVTLVLAGVSFVCEVGQSLQMVGLFVDSDDNEAPPVPKVFETLNGALEFCENILLTTLTEKQRDYIMHIERSDPTPSIDIPLASAQNALIGPGMANFASPRMNLRQHAAVATLKENKPMEHTQWRHFKQPLPLLLQTFQDFTTKNEDFWFPILPYFVERKLSQGTKLYQAGDKPDGFYLLQSGILRADNDLDQGKYSESIVPGTTCGELPFFSDTPRTSAVFAERDCVVWWLGRVKWIEMQNKLPVIAAELLKVGLKLSAERIGAVTSYVLITAS